MYHFAIRHTSLVMDPVESMLISDGRTANVHQEHERQGLRA